MTDLEKCMESLIFTFHRYAEAGGDGNTLSKKELKKLLENELPSFLKVNLFHLVSKCLICPNVDPSAHILAVAPHLLSLVLFSLGPEQPQAGGLHDERFGS